MRSGPKPASGILQRNVAGQQGAKTKGPSQLAAEEVSTSFIS